LCLKKIKEEINELKFAGDLKAKTGRQIVGSANKWESIDSDLLLSRKYFLITTNHCTLQDQNKNFKEYKYKRYG